MQHMHCMHEFRYEFKKLTTIYAKKNTPALSDPGQRIQIDLLINFLKKHVNGRNIHSYWNQSM